jgi:hypothetical protein
MEMSKVKIIRLLLAIIGFTLIIIFILKQPSNNEICIQKYKTEKSKFYNGLVTKKFINAEENNFKTVLLNNGQELWMNWDLSGLYEFITTNDSIVKDSGSYAVKVYRDSLEYIYVIDYGCE